MRTHISESSNGIHHTWPNHLHRSPTCELQLDMRFGWTEVKTITRALSTTLLLRRTGPYTVAILTQCFKHLLPYVLKSRILLTGDSLLSNSKLLMEITLRDLMLVFALGLAWIRMFLCENLRISHVLTHFSCHTNPKYS